MKRGPKLKRKLQYLIPAIVLSAAVLPDSILQSAFGLEMEARVVLTGNVAEATKEERMLNTNFFS